MIIKLLKLLKKVKFDFSSLEHKKVILFDCENTVFLEKLFQKKEYFILSTRYNNFKKIYVNISLLKYFILNYHKNLSLKQNYLLSIIFLINPKLLVTYTDISTDFHRLSKLIYKKIKCISIQRGARGDLFYNTDKERKNVFIPILFSFGEYEKKMFRLKKTKANIINPIGSISLFYANRLIKKKKLKKNKYDICLISEPHSNNGGEFSQVKNFADSAGNIAKFTHKLCEEEGLKLIFTGEGEKNSSLGREEIEFYRNYLCKFYIHQEKRTLFPSYQNIYQSKLIIGQNSTMLRESFGFNKKVLYCNLTGSKLLKAPIPNSIMDFNTNNYKSFKKRVLYLLSISTKNYFKNLKYNREFMMISPNKTLFLIKKKLKELKRN